MAIQHRRGADADYNPAKMLAGEMAVTTDGSRKVYVSFGPGDSREMAKQEDLDEKLENTSDELRSEIDEYKENTNEKIRIIDEDREGLRQSVNDVDSKAEEIKENSILGRNSIAANTDFNTIMTAGIYTVKKADFETCTNRPEKAISGGILVVTRRVGSSFGVQTYYEARNNMYIRFGSSNDWTEWDKLLKESEIAEKVKELTKQTKSDISKFGTIDIISEIGELKNETVNGITYEWDGRTCHVYGDASKLSTHYIFYENSKLLDFLEPGAAYRIMCEVNGGSGTDIAVHIGIYTDHNTTGSSTSVTTTGEKDFVLPENATGAYMRIRVNSGKTVDCEVKIIGLIRLRDGMAMQADFDL